MASQKQKNPPIKNTLSHDEIIMLFMFFFLDLLDSLGLDNKQPLHYST